MCSARWLVPLMCFVASCAEPTASIGDGTYYGYEITPQFVDPVQPEGVWFRRSELIVRGSRVELRSTQGIVLDGKVLSVGNPAVPIYDGTIEILGGRILVGLRLIDCEYCDPIAEDAPLPSKRIREYIVHAYDDGSFEINRVRYYSDENRRPYWMPQVE